MKKIVFLLLAILLIIGTGVYSFADTEEEIFVYDEANLLTKSEEQSLSEKLSRISRDYNAQVTVVTVSSLKYSDIEESAEKEYYNRFGKKRDGVLLLICMKSREYAIFSNGFVEEAIDEDSRENIGKNIKPDLSDGNYADAFDIYADRCEYYLNGYINGFPFEFMENLVISLIIGGVIGLIVVLILKSQLKSVRKKNHANVYVKEGSMRITRAADYFLYRRVTKIPRQTSSSSGSSRGGSRSVGGGSF